MSAGYIPTDEEVRACYQSSGEGLDFKRVFFDRGSQFDRWLARHDREVAAQALRDMADEGRSEYSLDNMHCPWASRLDDKAKRIEEGADT